MRRKKLVIYISFIALFTLAMTTIPRETLYSNSLPLVDLLTEDGKHTVDCGSKHHAIKFDIKDASYNAYEYEKSEQEPPGWKSGSQFYRVDWKNADGELYSLSLPDSIFNTCSSQWVGPYYVSYCTQAYVKILEPANPGDAILWVKIFYTGSERECEDKEVKDIPARPPEMTCYQVWINEDNEFEFVFWWEYADNNHVQIYDIDGKLVWEVDFAKGQSHFVADLPDGIYTVKTFHEYGHILQEFEIGKP